MPDPLVQYGLASFTTLVVVAPFGIVPVFVGMTRGMDAVQRQATLLKRTSGGRNSWKAAGAATARDGGRTCPHGLANGGAVMEIKRRNRVSTRLRLFS